MQNGTIARWQLGLLGFTSDAIALRLKRALLHRVYRGVYLVGHTSTNNLALPTAALLAIGPGSSLSHYTAAGLREIARLPEGIVDVTLPGAQRKSRKGLRIHGHILQPHDIRRLNGLPVTTAARTVTQLAHLVHYRELERLVDQALIRKQATVDELRAAAHGTPAMLRMLEVPGDIAGARSRAEAKLKRLIVRAGLPSPASTRIVAGFECDLVCGRSG